MEDIVTKKCKQCEQEKPLSEFYWNKTRSGKPYPNSKCKSCCVWLASLRYNPNRQRELRQSLYHKQYAKKYWITHPIKFMVAEARKRSKKYGLEFSITENDVFVPERCPYLNIPLIFRNGKLSDNSPSLDRIDPSKGYILGNIQVISVKANRMKNNASIDELIVFAENVLHIHSH